jgi:hypothetical protein
MPRAPTLAPIVLLPGLLLGGLLLSGCGYSPPARTDVSRPTYKADVEACESAVPSEVNKRNAKTGLAWFASPFTRWSQIDEGVNACMAGKGYGRVRACTAAELASGGRAGNQVVTRDGIRCSDPPRG